MMFSRGLSKSRLALFRQGTATKLRQSAAVPQQQQHQLQKVRQMGGGKYLHISETHTQWGEAFGVVCWLWVFHRARHDLAVMYGFRHPWEHAPDPFAPDDHGHGHGHHHAEGGGEVKMEEAWDSFSAKTMKMSEDDDDEDEDDEDDDDEDE